MTTIRRWTLAARARVRGLAGRIPDRRRIVRLTAVYTATAMLAGLVFFMAIPLPPARMTEGTDVFDSTGVRVARLFTEDRTLVALEEVSPRLVQAVIAIEDRFFRSHFGVNPGAALRAVWQAIRQGRIVSGFSTITQQLARNLYLSPDRSLRRKTAEMLWAVKIELHWSKDQILEAYLNEVYWGHGVYGIEEAARTYFGKSAGDLDLPEAALLAGLLQSPENYSPYNNREAAAKRREVVLNRLAQDGRISPEEAKAATEAPIKLTGLKPRGEAAYFVQYCVAQIGSSHPELVEDLYRRNYQIYTTLDPAVQAAAEQAVAADLAEGVLDANGIPQPQVAAVAVEPGTGFIRMMIGGRDYSESPFNRAVDARRQPGSTFKPFVYAAAIEDGYTPADTQLCAPRVFAAAGSDGYSPHDYGSQQYHNRDLTMREAVAQSCNVCATAWLETVGASRVIELAQLSGIVSRLEPTPSLALGCYEVSPLELCTAYATLAAGGLRASPVAVLRVVGPDGGVIEEHRPEPLPRAMRAGTAYIVTDLLKGVLRPGGTGAAIGSKITRPAAAKTGSTEGSRDAWFAGYTPALSVVVWVGHDNPSELPGGGAAMAGPIWRDTVQTGLKGRPAADFPRPAEVASIAICSETGLRANWTCEQVEDLCLVDLAQAEYCGTFHWLNVFGLRPRYPGTTAPPGTSGEPVTPTPGRPKKPGRR